MVPFDVSASSQKTHSMRSHLVLSILFLCAAFVPMARPSEIPAGTTLIVRTHDPISSNDHHGKRFAAVLDSEITVRGKVVAPAGSKVYGRVDEAHSAGRTFGQSMLAISLTDLQVNGDLVPIYTTSFQKFGAPSGARTARRAATGALFGAAIDGRRGAGRGAAIGATTTLVSPGQAVVIPRGTLLDFRLGHAVHP